jgi:hypothetical protein
MPLEMERLAGGTMRRAWVRARSAHLHAAAARDGWGVGTRNRAMGQRDLRYNQSPLLRASGLTLVSEYVPRGRIWR